MSKILCRWSILTLFALIIISIFSSNIFPAPEIEVASPFAKPLWLDTTLPPTLELRVSSSSPERTIEWEWIAPAKVSGHGECSELLWKTPEGVITLKKQQSKLSSGDNTLEKFSFDTRDIPFKRSLGVSPFANASEALFPSKGTYSLVLPSGGDAEMRIEGGRYGVLGTDHRGRDVLALFVSGIKVSLIIGLSATFIAAL